MGYEPSDQAPPIQYSSSHETSVDGETWIVRRRRDEPGTYDFDWVSGPNEGYGFGSSMSGRSELTPAQIEESIQDFMKGIDPATGFLAD